MQHSDLLDSKKFCAALDKLVEARTGTDEDALDEALGEVLTLAKCKVVRVVKEQAPVATPASLVPKKKRGRPRKQESLGPTLTPDEQVRYAAMADEAMKSVPDVAARMDRLMAAHVLPKVRAGQLRVAIPDKFEGRPLPSSNKVWLAALSRAGLPREELEWGAGADGMPLEAAGAVSMRVLKLG